MNETNILQSLRTSIILLALLIAITCVIYPCIILCIGQTVFSVQANGSIIYDQNGTAIGSKLIAQQFNRDIFFQPRPSAADYNAAASASSSLAVSNYALRDRVAKALGPIAKYADGTLVGPDIERWFAQDQFRHEPHIVAQWARMHPASAKAWINANPKHTELVENWLQQNTEILTQFVHDHPDVYQPKPAVFAVQFFHDYSINNPGKFPLSTSQDIQAIFFDMWRQDHPQVDLINVPADMVTTSASGLDPHITLQNAHVQLERVANAWAKIKQRDFNEIKYEINSILEKYTHKPLHGLSGESYINVLETNLELQNKYAQPTT